jgi:hypothetical protein
VRARVYGEPEVNAVVPLIVGAAGESVNARGASAGDITGVTLNGIVCNGVATSLNKLSCTLPPGVGSLSPVVVTRVGGYTAATKALSDLKYAPASVCSIFPEFTLRSPSTAIGELLEFNFTGSGFSLPGARLPSNQLTGSVAGSACSSLSHVGGFVVSCRGVNSTLFRDGADGVSLDVLGPAASTTGVRLRIYGKPSIFRAQPLPVSPDGGNITIVGVEFGRTGSGADAVVSGISASADILSVRLGPAVCSAIRVAGNEIRCHIPPGVGSLSPVIVTRRGGWIATYSDASVAYAPAMVTSIQPAFVLLVPISCESHPLSQFHFDWIWLCCDRHASPIFSPICNNRRSSLSDC